jgi:hypothetical protein
LSFSMVCVMAANPGPAVAGAVSADELLVMGGGTATPPQVLPSRLAEALALSLAKAPAALFPKARRLYFDKYPLEGHPQVLDAAPVATRFRTFVLRESGLEPLPEGPQPQLACRIHELAVVHWQADHATLAEVTTYLKQQWELEADALEPMPEAWFREGGAWVRVTLPGADPAPAEADPETRA